VGAVHRAVAQRLLGRVERAGIRERADGGEVARERALGVELEPAGAAAGARAEQAGAGQHRGREQLMSMLESLHLHSSRKLKSERVSGNFCELDGSLIRQSKLRHWSRRRSIDAPRQET